MLPVISAVMPVHNGAKYLKDAVASILRQDFIDIELIVVNDGSVDETEDILKGFQDRRLSVANLKRVGLVGALNHGFKLARGSFIARMDADDVAELGRFSAQLQYLERERIDIACSDITRIDADSRVVGTEQMAGLDSNLLRSGLLFEAQIKPVVHPTVIMRREVYETVGEYRNYAHAEDHDYWLRAVDRFRFGRLNQRLLKYRVHDGSVSATQRASQATSAMLSVVNYLVECETGVDLYERSPDALPCLSELLRPIAKRTGEVLAARAALKNMLRDKKVELFPSCMRSMMSEGLYLHPYVDSLRISRSLRPVVAHGISFAMVCQ